MTDEGRGDWIQTVTGKKFYPLAPYPEDVDIFDISHSLGHQCRFGGHSKMFYSVAEHCVLLSYAVPAPDALWALMHDASEAYVVDVPRPLKYQLAGYREIENRVLLAIAARFRLPMAVAGELPPAVVEGDNRILLTERMALMKLTHHWPSLDNLEPLPVEIHGWSPNKAASLYFDRFFELYYPTAPPLL